MKTDFPTGIPASPSVLFPKQLSHRFLLIFILWLLFNDHLVASAQQITAVKLDEHVEFYEDRANQLTIEDIITEKANLLFKPTNVEKLLYINSNSSFWFRFSRLNEGKDQLPLFLELGYHVYDSIWLYKVNPDKTYTYELIGDRVPYNVRKVKSNCFVFELTSPPGQTVDYYVKIRCRELVKFHFTIYDYMAFYEHSLAIASVTGGVLMVFIAMFLYNFFIFIFTRNTAYAYYLVMVASVFFDALVIDRVGFHYLWPNWPWFQHIGEYVFNIIANPALILFTKSFLKTRDVYPKANKLLNVMFGLWILVAAAMALFNFAPGTLALLVGGMTTTNVVLILMLGVIALLQGYRPALFFLAGISLSLVAVVVYNLMFLGYIPFSFKSFYLPQVLVVTDTVLLSIALGENIRRMRAEIERSHIKINELKENANMELQKQVRERTLELEMTNKELEAFSYSVSHDLKAPLRGIKGFARLLQRVPEEKIGKQEHEIAGKIVTSADSMSSMIGDLLALSKVARGELQRTSFNPIELIEPITKDIVKGKDKTPEVITKPMRDMRADKNLMQHVFENLISNAVKYSAKRDHPVIEIGSAEHKGQTIFYIKDNGAGFDMKYASKLFQPFQRLHSPGEFDGTGIGLSIVRRIIERHGGKAWAEAEPDKGATFYFTIPDE